MDVITYMYYGIIDCDTVCFFFQVFNATNVQFITKTRMEHLSAQEKKSLKKNKSSVTPLENFLGLAERHVERTPINGVSDTDWL